VGARSGQFQDIDPYSAEHRIARREEPFRLSPGWVADTRIFSAQTLLALQQSAGNAAVTASIQRQSTSSTAPNQSGAALFVLPSDPTQLPPEWVRDPTHLDPNGSRWRHPSGEYLDFHNGRPGAPGWRGKDHWHHNGEDEHLKPGDEIREPPAVSAPPLPENEPEDATDAEEVEGAGKGANDPDEARKYEEKAKELETETGDPDFIKRMSEITGLTGTALMVYLIFSEGSRILFPPRNLIPAP
jgi:hypothetical protein